MAEESEGSDVGAEASGAGVDPFAAAMALGGASRKDAHDYLADQRALIADQRHHMREQFKNLRLGIWEKRLGVLLRIATAFTGLAVAAGLAFLIWDASQSGGLVMEPFSVPPDLATRGLTGNVIAASVLDRLTDMQEQTSSLRAPRTYSSNWDQGDIKLDIPDTGVSLAELDRFLRDKLGHDIHVSGAVVRGDKGITLTARADGHAESVTGAEADLDALEQRLAESVFRLTQPYRYGVFLKSNNNRVAEGVALSQALAARGPAEERAWGYNIWGNAPDIVTPQTAISRYRQGAALDPENTLLISNLGNVEFVLGQQEMALRDTRKALALAMAPSHGKIRDDGLANYILQTQADIDRLLGDYHAAAQLWNQIVAAGSSGNPGLARLSSAFATVQAQDHDLGAARATLHDPLLDANGSPGSYALSLIEARILLNTQAQDWSSVLAEEKNLTPLAQRYPALASHRPTTQAPFFAMAQARLGRFAEAEAQIRNTPGDCNPCLIARAQIAEMEGQRARADFWFNRAADEAPSIPFAESGWGQALLERGKPDEAIAKFTIANQKGPHFADPLEGWGEALMAQNRSDLALAKFTEAQKYAPNWGRLHLKWGEALGYAGKKDEAKKQFSVAAALDLTPSEKSELAGHP